MPTVIPVKFAYATRELWFDPVDLEVSEGDHVICSTERGTEIGLATRDICTVNDDELQEKIGDAQLKRVVRVATDADLEVAATLANRGDEALPTFRHLVNESGLDMKPVGVEFLFGGEKIVCYFAAEDRVDFRQLVRDLSHAFHDHVDMRQIGVREEAALMGGFAHCGQELCCARFGSGFEPVSIKMAKEQDLPLNSNKISGACGRLMCCLRYEFEAYRDFKQRAPKKNAVITTPLGTAKIVEYDTPKEQICLRLENGKQVRVPLAEMQASPEAHKKSKDLGCPCRPDTVTRETLDRLQSPELQAALEDIDRKNGVLPPETYESEDLFVDEQSHGRHRHNKSGKKATSDKHQGDTSGAQQGRDTLVEGARSSSTRHRRRHTTVVLTDEQAAHLPQGGSKDASSGKVSAPGEGRRSRRRHRVEGGAQVQSPQQSSAQTKPAPQKSAQPKAGQPQSVQPKAAQSHAVQPSKKTSDVKKRRRRPGDRGKVDPQARRSDVGTQSTSIPHADGVKRRRRHKKPSGPAGEHKDPSGEQHKGSAGEHH